MLVADRFHIIRLANDTVTGVRQRVIREDQRRRGRKTDPAWRVRRRLPTADERLRPQAFRKMWNTLVDTGSPGQEILHAYVVKEELRTLLALSAPTSNATSSVALCTGSTPVLPRSAPRRFTASPPPSRPGGRRSKPPSSPATPTPAPRGYN